MIDRHPAGFAPPWLAALAVLGVYLVGAGPTFYWLDSSELVAATWDLGIAHPPGHPLPSLLARLLCYLPLGTLALRVTLASALAAAATVVLIGAITWQLVARGAADPGLRGHGARGWPAGLGVTVGALVGGLSYAVWFQAVRAEVYALNTLLVAAGLYALLVWDRQQDRRALLTAGLLGGLALCNHHLLVLLVLPAMAIFVVARRPRSGWSRVAMALLLCGALGLSTLAYLPLRARQLPRVNWGMPTTFERFSWVISARLFQRTVDRVSREQPLGERAVWPIFGVLGDLGPTALLALGGLWLLLRRRSSRRAALLLGLTVAGNLVGPILVGFDPFNADAHGYLAVSVVVLACLGGYFIAVLAAELARRRWRALGWLVAVGAGVLPLAQLWLHWDRCDLRRHWAAEETSRAQLDQPQRALLFTSYFETLFNAWALRSTADLRPDIDLVHRNFLGQPGYLSGLEGRLPRLKGDLRAIARDGLSVGQLDRLARARPVRVEQDLNLSREVSDRLWPAGLVAAYGSPSATAMHLGDIDRWHLAIDWPPHETETRRAATWLHFQLARLACSRGLGALFAHHLAAARRLAPGDRTLARLAARCAEP